MINWSVHIYTVLQRQQQQGAEVGMEEGQKKGKMYTFLLIAVSFNIND